ncbi:hypothetical protein AXG93_1817s1040 [Marchantia polymorpha subsp. ruderalis]|uniref:Uncharacterized protein n=1 Tax=Marchantia polymorpha subsp. ruderalis TaxID=1480154 RepID=A0A176VK46_MARPO|nr:hypothetical protein AXG93_1817s1040 [Marchantia polymorpha subsp. ruderalis]
MSTSNYGPDVQANDNLFDRNADSIPGDVRLDPSEIPRAHGQTGNTRHEDLQRQSVSFSRPRETNHSKYCDLQGRANGDTDTNDASATQRQQSQAHDTDHDSDELVSSSKITTQGHRTRKSSRLSSRQSISQDLALIDWSQEKRSMLLTAASRSRFSRQDDETEKPASFVPRTLEVVLMRRMTSKLNATIRYIDIMILQTIRDDRFVLAIVKDPDDVSDMKNNDYLLRVKLTFNCVPNPANNYMAESVSSVMDTLPTLLPPSRETLPLSAEIHSPERYALTNERKEINKALDITVSLSPDANKHALKSDPGYDDSIWHRSLRLHLSKGPLSGATLSASNSVSVGISPSTYFSFLLALDLSYRGVRRTWSCEGFGTPPSDLGFSQSDDAPLRQM